jgi:uncharacterized membrane protein YoaK (UPF0700 family)
MPGLPVLLSFNGGYVDTAGFLALQGLFTAHVTGNFVTLGAALAFGTTGILSKLLALPTFCAIVLLTRLSTLALPPGQAALAAILFVKFALLCLGAVLAMALGPFRDGDSGAAIATGLVFVAAMAIQNAAHRMYLGSAPPSTLMTGTTTQLMIDLADSIKGASAEQRQFIAVRRRQMGTAVVVFAVGALLAAFLFIQVRMGCFLVPPFIALWARLVATHKEVTA